MRKRISLFFAALYAILIFTAMVYSEEENLLQNASFEEGEANTPTSWSSWAWDTKQDVTEFKLESGAAHSGSRFVTIINNKENDARYRQMVNIKEESFYRLSCWIKTDNVGKEKTGANISIEGRVDTSRDFKGTNAEWEYTELYMETGKDINNIVITIGLGGYGNVNTGEASFDDIKMEEVESIPAGEPFALVEPIGQNEGGGSENGEGNSSGADLGKPVWILIPIGLVIAAAILYNVLKKRGRNEKDVDVEIFESDYISDEDDYNKQ